MNIDRIRYFKEDIERRYKRLLSVKSNLISPDDIIIKLKADIDSRSAFHSGKEKGYISTHRFGIPFFVTPKNIKRALAFLDAFIKLGRARNHQFVFNGFEWQIVIENEKLNLGLERNK